MQRWIFRSYDRASRSRQMVDDFARRIHAAGYDDGTVLPVYRSDRQKRWRKSLRPEAEKTYPHETGSGGDRCSGGYSRFPMERLDEELAEDGGHAIQMEVDKLKEYMGDERAEAV